MDPILTGAVNSGMTISQQSLSDVGATCSTNKCVWKAYETLGICSSVEDISSTMESSSNTILTSNGTLISLDLILPEIRQEIHSELVLSSYDPLGQRDFWVATRLNRTLTNPANKIADFYVVYFPPCAVTNVTSDTPVYLNADWLKIKGNYRNWKAFKASLHLCLQTLTSSFANGITETVSRQNTESGDSQWQILEPITEWTPISTVYYHPNESPAKLEYYMNTSSLAAIGDQLFISLNGSALIPATGQYRWSSDWTFNLGQAIYGSDPMTCVPPNLSSGTGIYGFERVLNNVAISLTNTRVLLPVAKCLDANLRKDCEEILPGVKQRLELHTTLSNLLMSIFAGFSSQSLYGL